MRAKSLLLMLLVLPLTFGQSCTAPVQPEPEVTPPVAPTPITTPVPIVTPSPTPPATPPVTPIVMPPPTDPITTPPIVAPIVIPPYVPPVIVPPAPPKPAEPEPIIIMPTPVPVQKFKHFLTADEIGYVWVIWCNGILSPPDSDPNGPDPAKLRVDTDSPLRSYHDIFCRFAIGSDWPANPNTVLLNLFCLDNSESYLGISRLLFDFDPKILHDPWQIYCEPSSSDKEFASNYEPGSSMVNQWYPLDITETYKSWISGEADNRGLVLEQRGWYGDFTSFASAQYPDESKRPWILAYSGPALQLKMPLPKDKAWLLTTEAGGGDCASSWTDSDHAGTKFYSLDFTYRSATGDGTSKAETNVEVLASADGIVAEVGNNEYSANGRYVAIDHQPKGYRTYYLHLRDTPLVKVDDRVAEGCQLGVMGDTGASDGVHVHFCVRYNGDGSEDNPKLKDNVTLEGRSFADFKTGCENGTWNVYYESSNGE